MHEFKDYYEGFYLPLSGIPITKEYIDNISGVNKYGEELLKSIDEDVRCGFSEVIKYIDKLRYYELKCLYEKIDMYFNMYFDKK